MNKNMSASYIRNYGQKAEPSSGATVPASKDNRGCEDTLTAKHETATVRDAKEEKGAAAQAISRQCGHPDKPKDNMATGNSGMGPNVEANVKD